MAIPMKLEKAKLVKVEGGGGGLLGDIASMGASLGASLAGIGGMLPVVWTESEMNFRFNPTQLALNKEANYQGTNTRSSEEGGQEQYSNTGTRTLSFSVLLDEWEAPVGSDVGSMVDTLQKWCNPEADSDPPSPPTAMFVWGKFRFIGQLKSVNATFNLFRPRRLTGSCRGPGVDARATRAGPRPEPDVQAGPAGDVRAGSSRVTRLPSIALSRAGRSEPVAGARRDERHRRPDWRSVPDTRLLIPSRGDAKAARR